jgi:hypothetical protein
MSEDRSFPEDYRTTTHRGRDYPVPGDWALGIVEGDGVGWSRYEGLDADLKNDAPYGELPDDEASLILRHDDDGTTYHKLSVNGERVARIQHDLDEDRFWQVVAECLWWVVDEDAGDDPLVYAGAEAVRYETVAERAEREAEREQRRLEETQDSHQTLDAFGGGSA